jgi:hypothetical protein
MGFGSEGKSRWIPAFAGMTIRSGAVALLLVVPAQAGTQ